MKVSPRSLEHTARGREGGVRSGQHGRDTACVQEAALGEPSGLQRSTETGTGLREYEELPAPVPSSLSPP